MSCRSRRAMPPNVNTRMLVLDLRAIEDAAPLHLFRAVFPSAAAFHPLGRRFERVVLAGSGEPVFVWECNAYAACGAAFVRIRMRTICSRLCYRSCSGRVVRRHLGTGRVACLGDSAGRSGMPTKLCGSGRVVRGESEVVRGASVARVVLEYNLPPSFDGVAILDSW